MDALFLNEHRCRCGKLLLKGIFFDGTLEIKCRRCGEINKIGNTKLLDDGEHYFLIINEDGNIINANDLACRKLGFSYEELIGKHFIEINPSLPKEIHNKFFGVESILNEDNYFQLDTVHRTKNGSILPVIVLLKLYKPLGKRKNILVSAEIKKADNKKNLDDSSVTFVDNACDFYFDIDKNGVLDYISPFVKDYLVFSQEDAIGKNFFECVPIGNRNESKKLFKHFSAKGEPYRTEDTACLSTNGKTLYTEYFFTPKFNDMGKFIGYRILVWATRKN